MTLTKGELKWSDQNISKTGLFKAHRIILRIPRIEKRQNVTYQKTKMKRKNKKTTKTEKQKKQGVH